MSEPDVSVGDVVAALDTWYPPATADGWDAVGTSVGDPADPVRRVLLAVDPLRAVVDEAVAWDADLVVTHHPLLLKGVHSVATTTPKGRVVHDLIRHGIALHTCHTNADAPRGGVSEAMAHALGLTDVTPLEPASLDPLEVWTVYVPHAEAERVALAMHDAGAGALGDYDRARFTSTGEGTFRPNPGADPTIGEVGVQETVPETRVEMIAAARVREAVRTALVGAHPYEEPAYSVVATAALDDLERGSGRIGTLAEPTTVAGLAQRCVDALPGHGSAVRVAGDPDAVVRTLALCGGAGDFLLETARARGVDAYVTSDLRHHPVSELREHAGAPAVLDVPHWAAEWTWLPVIADRLRAAFTDVEVRVSEQVTDPWTFHLPSSRG
ncbi:dinuclear metal center YbgI/SA1388 family protein [Mumia flava]|uniref:GTP cyclohydrolase 1 type 2 homolog n=1 Tax=Mumia flava TaxID=1348852 RepID=A0A0B2BBJ6_9ACTN|nr:Nif3-like dinuclear metal center hexameric protein [Mumia flava]PJJ53823.1 dinuclear metal center YbgI/SA1388 family protein [Mumia flava]